MAGLPPLPPGFDPTKLPPLPPGMDLSKIPVPPGFDPRKLPNMPFGFGSAPSGPPPPPPGAPPGGLQPLSLAPLHMAPPASPPSQQSHQGPPGQGQGAYPMMPSNIYSNNDPYPPQRGGGYRGGYGGRGRDDGYGGNRGGGGGGYRSRQNEGWDEPNQGGAPPPPAPMGDGMGYRNDRGGQYEGGRGGGGYQPRHYDAAPDPYGGGGAPMHVNRGGYQGGGWNAPPPPPPPSGGGYGGGYGAPTGGYLSMPGGPGPRSGPPPLKVPTNTVWIGNVDSGTHSDEVLFDEFSKYGRVLKIGRLNDKGVAFIHYGTIDEATRALNAASANQALGPEARFNFGKQYDYTPEELAREWRPRRAGGGDRGDRGDWAGGGGGGGRSYADEAGPGDRFGQGRYEERQRRYNDDNEDGGGGYRGRAPRREPEAEPSNILWVGNVTPNISADLLRREFQTFGSITSVNKPEGKNMAFIHFDSIDSCRSAKEVMDGVLVGGQHLKLGFGKPLGSKRDRDDSFQEPATNVVWLGALPPEVNDSDVRELFDLHPGFISSKLVASNAFGHFDTIENATNCRSQLQGYELYGQVIKVGFGKTNHNLTMADRHDAKGGAGSFGGGGALVVANAGNNGALLPTEYGLAKEEAELNAQLALPKWKTRVRPSPNVTLETRVGSLLTASYYNCGDADRPLSKEKVDELIDLIDNCNSPEGMDRIYNYFVRDAGFGLTHGLAVMIKRIKQYHSSDLQLKGYCFYAISRLLLEQGKFILETNPKLEPLLPALDLYELLTWLCSQMVDEAAQENIATVVKGICNQLLKNGDQDFVAALTRLTDKKKVTADFKRLLSNIQVLKK